MIVFIYVFSLILYMYCIFCIYSFLWGLGIKLGNLCIYLDFVLCQCSVNTKYYTIYTIIVIYLCCVFFHTILTVAQSTWMLV